MPTPGCPAFLRLFKRLLLPYVYCCRTGTLYVSHGEGNPGAVSSYTPQGDLIGQMQTNSQAVTGLKLNAAEKTGC